MSNSNAFRVRKALQVNDNDLFVSGSKVRIGTTTSTTDDRYKLYISSSTAQGLAIESSAASANLQLRDNSGNDVDITYIGGAFDTLYISKNVSISGNNLDITENIRHASDADTKISFPQENTVTIHTANNERLRVTSTGNVGIGKTNPGEDLDVNGTIIASSYKSSDGSVGLTKQISIEDNSGDTHVFNFKNGLLVSHVISQ